MKTLTISCSKILAKEYKDRGFLAYKDGLSRPEIRFLKYHKHGHVGVSHLVSLRHRTIHPIFSSSSSSLSSESQVNFEAAKIGTEERFADQAKTVHIKVQLRKECLFGEQFLIVGDDPMFGLWDPSNAVPLDWSDGHIWTVELDIPIGKSIQFKLILKGRAGNIMWQPGPDRILSTWETTNTISVFEDWENAELQKVTEEGPVANQNEESTLESELLIVAENLTQPKEEQINIVNKASTVAHTVSYLAENPLVEMPNEQIVAFAQNITYSQKKPIAIVAENITYPKEETLVNANNNVLDRKGTIYAKEEPVATENENTLIAENIVDHNGRAAAVENLASTKNAENMVTNEGEPVLVPDLTPLSTMLAEEAPLGENQRSVVADALVGANEASNHNVPEFIEEQEPDCDPQHGETTKMMFNDEEELHGTESHLANKQEQPELKAIDQNVLDTDIQWGRKTLQKLLTNLGFF